MPSAVVGSYSGAAKMIVMAGGVSKDVYTSTSAGSMTVTKAGTARVVVIGGGGPGGSGNLGGGGAGGFIDTTISVLVELHIERRVSDQAGRHQPFDRLPSATGDDRSHRRGGDLHHGRQVRQPGRRCGAPAQVNAETGNPEVQYDWADIDTAAAGSFRGEFRVQYADGARETFPNRFYVPIVISAKL